MMQSKSLVQYASKLDELAKPLKPHFEEQEVVDVTITPSEGILDDFAETEYAAINLATEKSNATFPFDVDTFKKFCVTYVVSRIAWINNQPEHMIVRPDDQVIVPALLDTVLKNIGIVYETTQGLVLKPTIDYDSCETLSKDKMLEISFYLRAIDSYVGATGYIKDKSGSWEFMSMQLVVKTINDKEGSYIYSLDKDNHPVGAILAAIVAPKVLVATLSPRANYGNLTFFKSLLWELTSC